MENGYISKYRLSILRVLLQHAPTPQVPQCICKDSISNSFTIHYQTIMQHYGLSYNVKLNKPLIHKYINMQEKVTLHWILLIQVWGFAVDAYGSGWGQWWVLVQRVMNLCSLNLCSPKFFYKLQQSCSNSFSRKYWNFRVQKAANTR